jgi:hypothetical protein
MYYWLNGWFVQRFSYAESTAWEEDFKRAALGGTENYYLDSVDLMFYVGHGSPGQFTFDNTAHDDSTLNSSFDCDTSWGDGDNEWLALTSCQVLSGSGLSSMAQCMYRQHLILGFVTNASAHNNWWDTQSYHFGRYLRYGYNMTQAWFYGCDIAQRGRTARVIAEETNCFNDNPYYSSVCADTYDSDYYWWTHACGTASASALPLDALQIQELPVFSVIPYSAEEAQEDYSQLANVFGVPGDMIVRSAAVGEDVDPPTDPTDNTFLANTGSTSQTLEVDTESGIYHYANLDALFTESAAAQALALRAASANYISQDDAIDIANNFLNQNGLMPADAVVDKVEFDTTGTLGKPDGDNIFNTAGIDSEEDVAQLETTTNLQVTYKRVLTTEVATAAGVQQLEFTVVGPGAKQKVYLPPTGQVNAAGVMQADPLGAQGGWRAVEQAVNAASGEAVTVDIYNQATAEALYAALGDAVTMNALPMDITSYDVVSGTLAYHESSAGNSQGELIPVYQLGTNFVLATGANVHDFLYIPASANYLRPLAKILNAPESLPVDASTLNLTAEDATKTLQAAGIGGAQFPFVMGYAGAGGTYTYEWYLGSVADENKLTDTGDADPKTITFALPDDFSSHQAALTVILVVTDTDSPNESSSNAIAQITLPPSLFLPAIDAVEAEGQ